MKTNDTPVNQTNTWKKLQEHFTSIKDVTLRELFEQDPERGGELSLEYDKIYLDYSKNRITAETLPLLRQLLDEVDLRSSIDAMFSGEKINAAEDRAVLHIALRSPEEAEINLDGVNVVAEVHKVLKRMTAFAESIRSGSWTGYSDKPIRNIVHIGIGGSEIGPHMASEALREYSDPNLRTYFISNVDPANFFTTTAGLNPEETLFIVASKSFTTVETLTNADSARQWLLEKAPDESAVAKHFVALSTNKQAVADFGIDIANMFEMWDWVGGRYSLMSSVGLVIMTVIGPDNFKAMLEGAHSMDEHFEAAPFEENIPVTLALISLWYSNFFGAETELFVPYSSQLDRFTTYFQQANMESNGKSVTTNGELVEVKTGPIVWGKPGTDAQHTFMQHVHQGRHLIPTDILIFKEPHADINGQHTMLLANALAQAEALAFGKTDEELAEDGVDEKLIPQMRMPGNRPTNTVVIPKLTPYSFGQLIATYEHKIFVQGKIWGINSFDQWGVQLGKELATKVLSELSSGSPGNHDSSTRNLISKLQK